MLMGQYSSLWASMETESAFEMPLNRLRYSLTRSAEPPQQASTWKCAPVSRAICPSVSRSSTLPVSVVPAMPTMAMILVFFPPALSVKASISRRRRLQLILFFSSTGMLMTFLFTQSQQINRLFDGIVPPGRNHDHAPVATIVLKGAIHSGRAETREISNRRKRLFSGHQKRRYIGKGTIGSDVPQCNAMVLNIFFIKLVFSTKKPFGEARQSVPVQQNWTPLQSQS